MLGVSDMTDPSLSTSGAATAASPAAAVEARGPAISKARRPIRSTTTTPSNTMARRRARGAAPVRPATGASMVLVSGGWAAVG